MKELIEKMINLSEAEEDKYDPEKNLRSKVIDMFYKEDYSLAGEQKVDLETHLEFKKGDSIVKVVIPT